MATETIADIVREMRDYNDIPPPRRAWFDLAYRIEAAVKATIYTDNSETLHNALAENERLRAALDECVRCAERYEMDDDYQMSDICRDIRDCRRDAMGDEYLGFDKENKLLRAALKPVLSFDIDTHPCDGYCVMLNAVREAQRIAREGEAK